LREKKKEEAKKKKKPVDYNMDNKQFTCKGTCVERKWPTYVVVIGVLLGSAIMATAWFVALSCLGPFVMDAWGFCLI
jgi:hypothetical protein